MTRDKSAATCRRETCFARLIAEGWQLTASIRWVSLRST